MSKIEDQGTSVRILLIGARGMLGRDMMRSWLSDEVIPSDSSQVDIRDRQQVLNLVSKVRPDWAVLSAAYTNVDGSEENKDLAFAVNAAGV